MNEEALKLTLSSSPHAHSPNSTRRIMLDVCIALLPALIGAIVFFGARALTLTALSVAGCVFFEWAYRRIMKKDNTTGDLSAVVTGILVAFVCPVTLPFWTILIGDFFAIVVVKQLFGGIGANIVNPALAARAFLFSWPLFMNTWVRSGVHVPAFSNPTTASLDGLTAATPMASLHVGAMPEASVLDLFLGRTGCSWAASPCSSAASSRPASRLPISARSRCWPSCSRAAARPGWTGCSCRCCPAA